MVNYIVREPNEKEIFECINVLYTSFGRSLPEDIKKERDIWSALIKNDIGKFLIAEREGIIFGIGGAFIFDKVCSYGYMAVLPEYRGNGVGTEIFRNLIISTKNMKCETHFLYASNLGKFIYKKFGFQERFYGIKFNLPSEQLISKNVNKEVKILNFFPDWLISLDKEAMGFDRAKYLKLRLNLDAKVLAIENEGYGLLATPRLGPLITTNLNAAILIIKKSIEIGADHMIIAKHPYLPKNLFNTIELNEMENSANIKMVCGKEIFEKLDLQYAIGTFAKS